MRSLLLRYSTRNLHRFHIFVPCPFCIPSQPEPATDEIESMKRPARRADELTIELECDGSILPRVVLTGKQLDGDNNDEPISMVHVCLSALERTQKAPASARGAVRSGNASCEGRDVEAAGAEASVEVSKPSGAVTATTCTTATADSNRLRYSLKAIRVPSKDPRVLALEAPREPVCFTPARHFLTMGANTRIAIEFFGVDSAERTLLVKVGLKEGLPRLVESQMVGFTRIAASSPALDSTDIATFTRLAQSHGPLAAKELHIDRHGFGADGALKLAPLLASAATLLPNLEKLDLSYNALSDAGLRAICSALADGKASDDREASSGVEAAKLLGSEASHKASCLRLRCLDLTHNSIGDEGFDSLLRAFRDGSMRVGELLIRDGNSASEAAHSRLISGWKRAKELHRKLAKAEASCIADVTEGQGVLPVEASHSSMGNGSDDNKGKKPERKSEDQSDDSFSDDDDGASGVALVRPAVDISDPLSRMMMPMAPRPMR